ncbi:hypothetical protein [Pyrobaculum sp.]|uniref:hypothetical protein n=1 Tax=Pyrobaculum sp. TaxID=2004705 RepID=UPI003D126D98
MSSMCIKGTCIGYFECLGKCGTCNANCPFGCCCEIPANAPPSCGICPGNAQCVSVTDCQSRGGTCSANCPLGCCCDTAPPPPPPQAQQLQPQPQQTGGRIVAPTQTTAGGVSASISDLFTAVLQLLPLLLVAQVFGAFGR